MEEGNQWSWEPPEDMERRRLADLKRYKLKNPGYTEVKLENQQLQGNRNRNGGGGKPASAGKLSRPGNCKPDFRLNRWNLQTTLELLEEMKAVVLSQKVARISTENWDLIASNLPNPYGLKLEAYANSCKVRLENIRRFIRGDKHGRVDDEVRDSVADFNAICARFEAPKDSRSSPPTPRYEEEPLELSTDYNAICARFATPKKSLSSPSTPGTEEPLELLTNMEENSVGSLYYC